MFIHSISLFLRKNVSLPKKMFRTIVPVCVNKNQIEFESEIVSFGSCFSLNMAKKLGYYKMKVISNPFGILFHPLAIEKVILKSIENELFTKNDFFFHNDKWLCFDLHSELSQPTLDSAVERANQQLLLSQKSLQSADFIFITLGTAWVYMHETGKAVANCHKVPQQHFSKRLLSFSEIENSLHSIFQLVKSVNPKIHCICTISPVRHIKDGFTENSLSKSLLIIALHAAIAKNNHTSYFPAYEIMMDELRDYRFYGNDMLHPSEVAIDYIWKRFIESYFTSNCLSIFKEVDSIQKGLQHRPFNTNSTSFISFQEQLHEKITRLKKRFPFVEF